MRIYTCEPSLEAYLTTVYEAFACRLGHEQIKLIVEPVNQYTLFDEYIHIDADDKKVNKVINSIISKISFHVYKEIMLTALSSDEDVLDNIYHVLILGFAYGSEVLNMVKYKDIMRNQEIRLNVKNEICRFREFIRFHQLGETYVAHFEPKHNIAVALGPIFEDRMPSENFIIIDDVHREAVIHTKDESFYVRKLTKEELDKSIYSEDCDDEYTDLWCAFFNSISIKERENPDCQRTHAPIWTRKHMVEFK